VLAELIRDMAVAKGSGKGFDDSRFSDRIAFTGPVLALESIRQAVTTRVLERLESSWDYFFGKLVEYKSKNGDCRVPIMAKANRQLGTWVNSQRNRYSEKKLSLVRQSRLEAIGFEWNLVDANWDLAFKELTLFREKNGHCLVVGSTPLAQWVKSQRRSYSKRQISEDRLSKLKSIDFAFDARSVKWDEAFSSLQNYKLEHGDCKVPLLFKPNKKLGTWVNTQRNLYANGKLSSDKIDRLEAIGFVWHSLASQWDEKIKALKDFKAEHGHCRIDQSTSLGQWINRQCSLFSKGKLSADRVAELESIGIVWNLRISKWESKFDSLTSYIERFGHSRVPRSDKNFRDLAIWINTQRKFYSQGKLPSDRIAKLEGIGFEWKLR